MKSSPLRSGKRQDAHYHHFNISLEVLTRRVKVKTNYKIYDLEGRNKMDNIHRLSLYSLLFLQKIQKDVQIKNILKLITF